jgi:hypothetical protein
MHVKPLCPDGIGIQARARASRKIPPAPKPDDPSWLKPRWKPKKGRGLDAAADDSAANVAARKAYEARNRYYQDAYRRRAGKPPLHSPISVKSDAKPAWNAMSNVGPDASRSPYRDQRMTDGQKAYVAMCDRLSRAYLKNRRPFTPGEVV